MNSEILNLQKLLDDADLAYYSGNPIMTNSEYDKLVDKWKSITNSEWVNKSSESIMGVRLGSLKKINKQKDIESFVKKNPSKEYLVSDKLDGISSMYVPKTQQMWTRKGVEITQFIPYLKLPTNVTDDFYIRGELLTSKQKEDPQKHVAAIFNTKFENVDKELLDDVYFVAYEIINPKSNIQKSLLEQYKMLDEMGFKTPWNTHKKSLAKKTLESLLKKRLSNGDDPIDGLVIASIDEYERSNSKDPAYMVAFKISDVLGQAVVEKVEFKKTRFGDYFPTIHFKEPLKHRSKAIKKVSGKSMEYIIDNNIGVGDVLEISYSGSPFVSRIHKKVFEGSYNIPLNTYDDETYVKILEYMFKYHNIKGGGKALSKKIIQNGISVFTLVMSSQKYDFLTERENKIVEELHKKTYEMYKSDIIKLAYSMSMFKKGVRLETLRNKYKNDIDSVYERFDTNVINVFMDDFKN